MPPKKDALMRSIFKGSVREKIERSVMQAEAALSVLRDISMHSNFEEEFEQNVEVSEAEIATNIAKKSEVLVRFSVDTSLEKKDHPSVMQPKTKTKTGLLKCDTSIQSNFGKRSEKKFGCLVIQPKINLTKCCDGNVSMSQSVSNKPLEDIVEFAKIQPLVANLPINSVDEECLSVDYINSNNSSHSLFLDKQTEPGVFGTIGANNFNMIKNIFLSQMNKNSFPVTSTPKNVCFTIVVS